MMFMLHNITSNPLKIKIHLQLGKILRIALLKICAIIYSGYENNRLKKYKDRESCCILNRYLRPIYSSFKNGNHQQNKQLQIRNTNLFCNSFVANVNIDMEIGVE